MNLIGIEKLKEFMRETILMSNYFKQQLIIDERFEVLETRN